MCRRPKALDGNLAGTLAWLGVPSGDSRDCVRARNLVQSKSTGYYEVQFAGRRTQLHRLIVETREGRPLARDEVVRHLCGHKWCINPRCLVAGTPLENMRDQYAHGTRVMGDRHPQAKVSDAQVAEIRALIASGIKDQDIAARYGVARQTIGDIRLGRRRQLQRAC